MHFLLSFVAVAAILAQQPEPKLESTKLSPPGTPKAESNEAEAQPPAPQQRPVAPEPLPLLEPAEDEIMTEESRPSSQGNRGRRVAAFWIVVPKTG